MKMVMASLVLAVSFWWGAITSHASLVTIDPASDGSLYTCAGCTVVSDGAYVLASGYIQGVVKFPTTAIPATITQAFLTLNPYALPLFGESVDVYGYGTPLGPLADTDANAGTFLGTLFLPAGLGYGQDVLFDVTAFVAGTVAPYLAFNLRSVGTAVFSSLEYNYGHPAQLLVTTAVPEPAAIFLVVLGLLLVARQHRSMIVRPRASTTWSATGDVSPVR